MKEKHTEQEVRQNLDIFASQNYIAVVDLEATCTDNPELRDSFINEIIEIGLVIWNKKENTFDEFQIYVKPKRSVITPFCTQLTGISNETLKDAISFEDALKKVESIFNQYPELKTWTSFGDYDRNQLRRQSKRETLQNPFDKLSHINIKNTAWTVSGRSKALGLGNMLTIFGLTFEGNQHCGVDDAYNIARLAEVLVKKHVPTITQKLKG